MSLGWTLIAKALWQEEVLCTGVEVSALLCKMTLQCKTLNEISDVEELVTVLRQECEAMMATLWPTGKQTPSSGIDVYI